jgi:phosphotransferase system enzyme I (PtsI)
MGRQEMRVLRGLGVSEGVAIGRAVCIETRAVEVYRFPIAESEVEHEVERLREAVRRTDEEIRRTRRRVEEDFTEDLAAIFDAHVLMLADSSFVDRIVERIRSEHVNAEWVVHRTTEELAARFAALPDPHLRERADDLQDVGRYLLRVLQGISHHELSELGEDIVIVADDLTPSGWAASGWWASRSRPAAGPRTPRSSPARSTSRWSPAWKGSPSWSPTRIRWWWTARPGC